MEDHNLADSSGEDAFQNGKKALALEVDPGPDVADDLDARPIGFEEADLPREVFCLVFGADSGVRERLLFLESSTSIGLGLAGSSTTEKAVDILGAVEVLASRHRPVTNKGAVGPGS